MIDLLQMVISIEHISFGTTRTKVREDGKGNTKLLTKTIWINHYPVLVTSLKNGTKIMIRCCPIKALQGHNVFGTNKVTKLGYQIITVVLNELSIKPTAVQKQEWRKGEFEISEIHLTHRFPVKSCSMIKQVVSHIHRYTSIAHRPAYIENGVGVRLTSPGLEWLFYDKRLEFSDKRHKEHTYLEAHAQADADEISRLITRLASKSIRAELKLKKRYLKKEKLNTGKAWTVAKVKEVYLSELKSLHLGELPSLSQLPLMYKRVMTVNQRTTLILWANGQNLSEYYARTKYGKHRKEIKEEFGIDIQKDAPSLKHVRTKLSDVFAPENMLAGFPSWAKKYPKVAFR